MTVEAEHPEPASAGAAALASLLAALPHAVVGAIGTDGRLGPVPGSVRLGAHTRFERTSGVDLVMPDDHAAVIDAWERAQTEPMVRVEVRLLGDPERPSGLHFVDVRDEHGVHMIVVDAHDPARLLETADALGAKERHVGHLRRDALGVFLEVDRGTTALLGWTADELVGRRTLDLVHPDDVQSAVDSWFAMRAGSGGRTRVRFRHADGHYRWIEVTNHNRLDDPEFGCVLSELVDISEEMAELEALHASERLLQRLAGALPIGICHLRPDREVVYSNGPFVDLLGPVDSVEALVDRVAPADRQLASFAVERALEGRESELEVGIVHGFEERRCGLTLRVLTSDKGALDGVIVCTADVTDRSRLRAELEHRASHDALSGCLNRAATVTALERALREHPQVAVAYLDLDRFKAINDDLGHAAGDEVLRIVAARLRGVTRVEDRVGRIGGDEFVVIAPQGTEPFDTAAFANRLTAAVNGDVRFARQRIAVRASIGAVVSRSDELDAEGLLSRADTAMYEAKRLGRRQLSVLAAVPDP